MIDYFLKFADEATAKAALAQHLDAAGNWGASYVIGGITVWRNSQDVGITHTPLAGFFMLVSLPTIVPALRDAAAVQVVIDRDMAKARQVGAVIKSNLSAPLLQDIRIAPVFAGTDLPYGAMQ